MHVPVRYVHMYVCIHVYRSGLGAFASRFVWAMAERQYFREDMKASAAVAVSSALTDCSNQVTHRRCQVHQLLLQHQSSIPPFMINKSLSSHFPVVMNISILIQHRPFGYSNCKSEVHNLLGPRAVVYYFQCTHAGPKTKL